MGPLWGLALVLFFCFWEAGAPGNATGLSTHGPGRLMAVKHTVGPAVTPRVNTSSEGVSQAADLSATSVPSHIPLETQTLGNQDFDRTLIPTSTISEGKTKQTKTIFPATESQALTKTMYSKLMVLFTTPVGTSATSDSPSGVGMTTMETITGGELSVAVFDILCTDVNSKGARTTFDALTLAPASAEARGPASESSWVPAIAASHALAPDVTVPPEALVACTITNIEVTNYSIIDIGDGRIGVKTPPAPETSALPDFTEAKSHLARTTTSSEVLSTAGTTESVTPASTVETPHTARSVTGGGPTAAKAATPSGTLETVSANPLKGTLPHSAETASPMTISGAVTVSKEADSTVGKVTSSAGSSPLVYNLSEVAAIKKPTHSEMSTTDSATRGPVLLSRSPPPSVHLTAANGGQEADITLAKTMSSAKTLQTASTARGQTPTATPTAAWAGQATEVTAGADEGFLLLRLSMASAEDLTDPRVAARLMHQLLHELHAHMPSLQVSLLRVRRN